MNRHSFSDAEKRALYKAMTLRRDMRHFNGAPVPDETLRQILAAANLAPSVGLMQPWRFIRITEPCLRQNIHQLVEAERHETATAMAQRREAFLQLKVEGVLQCSELLVAALADQREQHLFGRRTLPEMDLASLACAIQNMWLAARAEGIGMGWVSLFCPQALKELLQMPAGSHPVAILCLGQVDEFYSRPMLEIEQWAYAQPIENFVSENSWPQSVAPESNK